MYGVGAVKNIGGEEQKGHDVELWVKMF